MASAQQLPSRAGSSWAALSLLLAISGHLGAASASSTRRLRSRMPSQLLAMRKVTQAKPSATAFGPNNCVRLSKSSLGTCVITLTCGAADVSQVDFSFVCINRNAALKKAQHSYGTGGFNADEVFDSGVACDSCTTVEYARLTGGSPVHNELLTAPSPSHESKGVFEGLVPTTTLAPQRDESAFFGPQACISTYLSRGGTCMIQTRCRHVDLSNFAVGITCLDKTGDYTRYIFGKNGFGEEELFDTTLPCHACLGVGDQPSYQLSGLVPKTIVEDLGSLRAELASLKSEVATLKGSGSGSTNATSKERRESGTSTDSSSSTANATSNESGTSTNSSNSTANKVGKQLLATSAGNVESKPLSVRDLLRRLARHADRA